MFRKLCGLLVFQNIFAYIPHYVVYMQYLVMHSAVLLGAPALAAAAYAPPARAIKGGARAGIPSLLSIPLRGWGGVAEKQGGRALLPIDYIQTPVLPQQKEGVAEKGIPPFVKWQLKI